MSTKQVIMSVEEKEQFELRKSYLAITYVRRLRSRLEDPAEKRQRERYNYLQLVLSFLTNETSEKKNVNVTMKALGHIENILQKLFLRPKTEVVDLTEDDLSPTSPASSQLSPSSKNLKTQQRSSMITSIDLTEDEDDFPTTSTAAHKPIPKKGLSQVTNGSPKITKVVQTVPDNALQKPLIAAAVPQKAVIQIDIEQIPLPSGDLLPDLLIDFDVDDPPPAVQPRQTTAMARRKSVSSRPTTTKGLPSISEYKIKQHKLLPPSIYAKLIKETRDIITVPYKVRLQEKESAPQETSRQDQVQTVPEPFDPKESSIPLYGIKEQIYINKYLKIDVKKKEQMINEEVAKNKCKSNGSKEGNTDNVKDGTKIKQGRGRPPKKPNDVLDEVDDQDYQPPDHVLNDEISSQLEPSPLSKVLALSKARLMRSKSQCASSAGISSSTENSSTRVKALGNVVKSAATAMHISELSKARLNRSKSQSLFSLEAPLKVLKVCDKTIDNGDSSMSTPQSKSALKSLMKISDLSKARLMRSKSLYLTPSKELPTAEASTASTQISSPRLNTVTLLQNNDMGCLPSVAVKEIVSSQPDTKRNIVEKNVKRSLDNKQQQNNIETKRKPGRPCKIKDQRGKASPKKCRPKRSAELTFLDFATDDEYQPPMKIVSHKSLSAARMTRSKSVSMAYFSKENETNEIKPTEAPAFETVEDNNNNNPIVPSGKIFDKISSLSIARLKRIKSHCEPPPSCPLAETELRRSDTNNSSHPVNENGKEDEDDLLVEIPGKVKRIQKRKIYVPKREPKKYIKIKEEPID